MVWQQGHLAGLTAAVPYAGFGLDRATGRRDDPAWVAALAAGERARIWPLWRDLCLVAGDPPAPVELPWNRQQRYCGRCGSATRPRNAGYLRACANAGCGALLFPRIEPAVITLVETIRRPRRCLLARHVASQAGGYSLLAGFVEIGESLEDAVRREIFEEAGVTLRDVGYVGSQPWPFPAGIMVGFRATAADESLSVDGNEIREARWFTREELRDYGKATGRPGRVDSIDRVMLEAWLEEGTTDGEAASS